jgi:hypothetical protein
VSAPQIGRKLYGRPAAWARKRGWRRFYRGAKTLWAKAGSARLKLLPSRAHHMDDVSNAMRDPVNLLFVKAPTLHRRIALVHKLLMRQRSGRRRAILALAENDEPDSRRVQRGVAPPLAILFRGPGDDLLVRPHHSIDGRDIFGTRLLMRNSHVNARRLRHCHPLHNCGRLGNRESANTPRPRLSVAPCGASHYPPVLELRLDGPGHRVPRNCSFAEVGLISHVTSQRSVVAEYSIFHDRRV